MAQLLIGSYFKPITPLLVLMPTTPTTVFERYFCWIQSWYSEANQQSNEELFSKSRKKYGL